VAAVEGPRRLWALVNGLPAEAAVWREEMAWTLRDELAALQVELLDTLIRAQIKLWTGKNARGRPIRVERPDRSKTLRRPEPRKARSTEQVLDFFAKHFS